MLQKCQIDVPETYLARRKTLFVTNLKEDATREEVLALFAGFSPLRRIYIAKNKKTLRNRGYAYVTFTNHEEAEQALDTMQGHHNIKLCWAAPSASRKFPTTKSSDDSI